MIHWNRLILELSYKKLNIQKGTRFEDVQLKIEFVVSDISEKIVKYIKENGKLLHIYHRQSGSYQEIRNYILGDEQLPSQKNLTLWDFMK